MKKIFSNLSVKNKMISWFLSICLLSLLLMLIILQFFFGNVIKDELQNLLNETTKQLNFHLEYYFTNFYKSTHTLISSQAIQIFLTNDKEYSFLEIQEIGNLLKRYILFNYPEIINIHLVSADMRLISMYDIGNKDLINEIWYNNEFPLQPIVYPTHRISYAQFYGYPVMSLVVPVYNINNLELAGKLVIDFALHEITKTIENAKFKKTSTFFIVSADNRIIYHSDRELLGVHLSQTPFTSVTITNENESYITYISEKKYLAGINHIESQNWNNVLLVNYSEIDNALRAAQITTITIFIIIMIALAVIVPFTSEHISKPLIKKEMALVLREKEALIKALQNQINPHLLYNTLDIIKSIAYLKDIPQIVTLVTNLADVYRYSARSSGNEVTLYHEIVNLEKYLNIMNIRFPGNFNSNISVNKEHYNCLCQKLILQPIIENSVKYAIEPKGGKGIIYITSIQEGNELIIKISDDGQGISPEHLEEITRQLTKISINSNMQDIDQSSNGLLNVHARLVFKYGNKYGLRIESLWGQSTNVYVKIPFKMETAV